MDKGLKISDLESGEIVLSKNVAKTKALISCGVICAFFFPYAKIRFSNEAAQLLKINPKYSDKMTIEKFVLKTQTSQSDC